MKREVALVGGGGYIGQRLARYLADRGWAPEVIDPDIHQAGFPVIAECRWRLADIRDVPTNELPEQIVYLASFHDVPFWDQLLDGEKLEWQQEASEIMIKEPLRLIAAGKEVIYVSSMRALTHPETFYGNLKAVAERELFQKASIVRFGTVWGGLEEGLYNRTITVPNNWAVRGELPDKNWEAYVTSMDWAMQSIEVLLGRSKHLEVGACVSPCCPITAESLPNVVPYLPDFNCASEPHPAYATAEYYDLPLPKEDS